MKHKNLGNKSDEAMTTVRRSVNPRPLEMRRTNVNKSLLHSHKSRERWKGQSKLVKQSQVYKRTMHTLTTKSSRVIGTGLKSQRHNDIPVLAVSCCSKNIRGLRKTYYKNGKTCPICITQQALKLVFLQWKRNSVSRQFVSLYAKNVTCTDDAVM